MNKKKLILSLDPIDEDFNGEDFFEGLQKIIDRTKLKGFYVEAFNLNWQGKNGYQILNTTNAKTIFSKISPNTDDLSAAVYKPLKGSDDDYKFQIVIYTHDTPTGCFMNFYSRTQKDKNRI